MTAIASFTCKTQQLLASTPVPPAALPLPPCAHTRLSIGLDRACCPDCRGEFLPRTPEYKSAIAFAPVTTENGSGVPFSGQSERPIEEFSPRPSEHSPEPKPEPQKSTPEPKTVISTVQWVESYPTKKGTHHYYRFRWLDEPNDIRSGGHRHICGGNIHSALALARKAEIESAIASGQSPRQILHLIKSWKQQ